MDVKLGSTLWARDGRCGSVQHAIVDPGSRRVVALVVEYGPAGAVVVPVERVTQQAGRLAIDATRDEVAALPRFMSVDYCLPTETGLAWEGAAAESPCPQLWTRVPPSLIGEQRPMALPIEHSLLRAGEALLDKGMPVECRDGRCGEVADVLTDPGGGLAGIKLRRGFLFARELVIPAAWIDRVEGAAVHLRATREQIAKLADSEAQREWDQPP